MAPLDYIHARKSWNSERRSEDSKRPDEFHCVMVDDRPYLPFLNVQVGSIEAREESCRRAVLAIFGWNDEFEDGHRNVLLHVRPVSGGNTNVLLCVSNLSQIRRPTTTGRTRTRTTRSPTSNTNTTVPDKVLVRIFGAHGLIDRDAETSTYAALAQQGLALPYYGRFGNGRIEGWSEWKCLAEEEVGNYAIPIARAMATLHETAQLPPAPALTPDEATPTMWMQLQDWIGTAVTAKFPIAQDMERAAALNIPQWQDELTFSKTKVIPNDASVGFCHNDVLAANILCNDDGNNDNNNDNNNNNPASMTTKQVQLIDFEYGGFNYWSYDIANHFNEYAGGTNEPSATPNYDLFPSPQLQRAFVQEYLTTRRRLHPTGNGSTVPLTDSSTTVEDTEVEALLTEISAFVLANHLVWASWAVNQASAEGCTEFDYLQYAKCRIERYYEDRARWLEKHQPPGS